MPCEALTIITLSIVVCDAMQVYKRMDIGTAKPTTEDQQLVQHHFRPASL
jgi:tRNA A37 N6-isopentenylltransferase MiaA